MDYLYILVKSDSGVVWIDNLEQTGARLVSLDLADGIVYFRQWVVWVCNYNKWRLRIVLPDQTDGIVYSRVW